jgi:hypothetical protein
MLSSTDSAMEHKKENPRASEIYAIRRKISEPEYWEVPFCTPGTCDTACAPADKTDIITAETAVNRINFIKNLIDD